MKSEDALLNAWDATLARKRGQSAIFDPRGHVQRTFDAIEEEARIFSSKFDGLAPGNVVAVQTGNRPEWPAIFLACMRRRLVALPLETTLSQRERDSALAICQASAVISAVSGDGALDVRSLKNETSPVWGSRRPTLLKLTSGTTATPRAIRFRSEQLLADCDQICQTMGIGDADINFGVIPVSHSYGFSNLLTPLIARGISTVLSQDRLPRAVLHDLGQTNATVFPGMPVFFQAFCAIEKPPELSRLRLCISAGAPLTAAVAREFYAKFQLRIHSFYGASECGGICYDRTGKSFEDGFVGTPMEGVSLEILEPEADSSQICVRSAAVGDGYFPEPDERKLSAGIFLPDDLLSRRNGEFRIVGRISDVINVAGKKVNPIEVEAQLLRFAGVSQAIVFGRRSALRNEEVAACVVTKSDIQEADLLKLCREHLSGWQVPKRIFIVDKIPVNERGKTSRRDLTLQFAGK